MKKFVVTTTIREKPTAALLAYAAMPGWKLVVVGDQKTPHDAYTCLPNVTYLLPGYQDNIDATLSSLIGWNCIQRRNMGFVFAMHQGADLIATVDDDNAPLPNWGQPTGEHAAVYDTDAPAFDPLFVTNHPHLVHRGFPLTLVGQRSAKRIGEANVDWGVYAGLWNGDPDVDAWCRAWYPDKYTLTTANLFTSTKPMPFNSQNTILTRKALADYFCFPGCGRYDDIYASYVCQAHDHRVVFGAASVEQHRDGHTLAADMKLETEGYVNCESFVREVAKDKGSWRKFVPSRAADAFDRYRELMKTTFHHAV